MGWPLYWFLLFLFELGIISYVIYLHFEEKIMAIKPKKIKFKITRTITQEPLKEKTKREIMEG